MVGKTMRLKQEIIDWDGNSSDDIAAVYDRYHRIKSFSTELVELAIPYDRGDVLGADFSGNLDDGDRCRPAVRLRSCRGIRRSIRVGKMQQAKIHQFR